MAAVLSLRIGLGRIRSAAENKQPTVSVLVAARNEESCIANVMQALLRQDYPAERLEVIIIDDHSTDRTAGIVRQFSEANPCLSLIQAPPLPTEAAPKKNALLAGLQASSGEIILTTDADCQPGPGWVSGMVKHFEEETTAVAGYSPVEGNPARFDAFVNGVISAGTIGLGYPVTSVGRNFAYKRAAFEAVGGFGDSIKGASGDDDLLLQRLARNGRRITFAAAQATIVPAAGAKTLREWLIMKRRHLSAGTRYSAGLVSLFTVLYLFHWGLLAALVTTIAKVTTWEFTALIWGSKSAVDFLALHKGAELLHHRNWIRGWLAAEIISPLLICLVTPLALVGKVRWKGRELKR